MRHSQIEENLDFPSGTKVRLTDDCVKTILANNGNSSYRHYESVLLYTTLVVDYAVGVIAHVIAPDGTKDCFCVKYLEKV